jgi:hypothetical protein
MWPSHQTLQQWLEDIARSPLRRGERLVVEALGLGHLKNIEQVEKDARNAVCGRDVAKLEWLVRELQKAQSFMRDQLDGIPSDTR